MVVDNCLLLSPPWRAPKQVSTPVGPKDHSETENTSQSHSSTWPAAQACLEPAQIPGPEQPLSPEDGHPHNPSMRSKGRRSMELAPGMPDYEVNEAHGRGNRRGGQDW